MGNDTTTKNVLRWVRGKGAWLFWGINFQRGKIDYTPIWHQKIKVTGINCHTTEYEGKLSFDIAAELLGGKKIQGCDIEAFLPKRKNKTIKLVIDH